MIKKFLFISTLLFIVNCSTKQDQLSNEKQLFAAQAHLDNGLTDQAKKLLMDLCREDYGPGCSALGIVYQKNNDPGHEELFQKACNLKDGLGCYSLASIQYKKHESEAFKRNIMLSCEFGYKEACRAIKRLYDSK